MMDGKEAILAGTLASYFRPISWAITSRLQVAEDVHAIENSTKSALEGIIAQVTGHEREFRQIARYGVAGLRISIVSEMLPPCVLTSNLLTDISRLGVDLEIEVSPA